MPPQDPTFSVVMPAHNAERTIASAIRSVLLQSSGDFELLVVDDGSTDRTSACIDSFDDARIRVVRQENRGPASARNAAIDIAKGKYVSMLDSDDMWMPSYLEKMGAAIESSPTAGFAYTDAWVLEERTGRIRAATAMEYQRPPSRPPVDPADFLMLLLERNFVFTSATVRREVLDRVGVYDERLWYGEDYELWVRILAGGFGAVSAGEVLVIHRDRPDSLTSDTRRLYEGICRVYRTIGEKVELAADARAVVHGREEYWEKQLKALEHPSVRQQARRLARSIKQRATFRSRWLDSPPSQVAETLRACRPARVLP